MPTGLDDRIEGALLGTLVGDALGRPFEGTPRSDIERLRTALQRRVREPRAWGHTDDAEMMLAVAESVVARGAVHEPHLLDTLASRHEPARGYGKGSRAAFRTWRETGSWQLAGRALWEEGSRGNGGAVRVAAVAILHRGSGADDVRAAARRSARPTHCHEEALAGAEVIALAVWLALNGTAPGGTLERLRRFARGGPLAERMSRVDVGQPVEEAVRALGHGVLAIESVPLAVWAHCRNMSFDAAVMDAVSGAGDTDTIGAMTGAMAGAAYGAAAIPQTWLDALETPARRRARELAEKLRALPPPPSRALDRRG